MLEACSFNANVSNLLQPPAHPPVKLCNNNEKKFDSSNIKQLFRLSRLFPFLFYSCWREERLVRIFDVKLKSLASTSKNFSLPQNQAKDGVVYLDERRIRYGKSWSLFKVSTSKENCVLLKLSTNNMTSLKVCLMLRVAFFHCCTEKLSPLLQKINKIFTRA